MSQRAGNLNERVTFQRGVAGDDGYGNATVAWTDHLTVWADMLEVLGRETVATGRVEAARPATVRVRRSADSLGLTAADRLVCRGQVWNIRSIAAVSRDRAMLDILVEAGVAA